MQAFNLPLDVVRRHIQIVEGASSVDASGNQLRIPGEQTQDVNVFEEAHVVAVGPNGKATPAVARHQQQRLENEVVGTNRGDVEMRDVADWRVERKTLKDDRFGQIHARGDADAVAVPDEKGVDVGVAHAMPGV